MHVPISRTNVPTRIYTHTHTSHAHTHTRIYIHTHLDIVQPDVACAWNDVTIEEGDAIGVSLAQLAAKYTRVRVVELGIAHCVCVCVRHIPTHT